MTQAFDLIAETYDACYDTSRGRAIFNAELKCLRSLCERCQGRWLEMGVGTGRFASSLGVARGIDSSLPMLKIAAERGIITYAGRAEDLPFPEGSFDGALLVLAICFFADSSRALKECSRILRPGGHPLLGVIPGESPWGRAYERKKTAGHPVYSLAKSSDVRDILALTERTGFTFRKAASTLFRHPNKLPEGAPRIEATISPDAGFVSLLFAKE
jgi:ubiquinone/menaquinone biosynthesis C-methylase UbiE